LNILILNGVNLNMLGKREPKVYGHSSYMELVEFLQDEGTKHRVNIEVKQTNYEGEYVEWIQSTKSDYLIINPGAWTHYSYAILDAVRGCGIPYVEVHLSDIKNREEFRSVSLFEKESLKTISGKGFESYKEAIEFLVKK